MCHGHNGVKQWRYPRWWSTGLAATCEGKDRDELIWPAADGGYLAPPTTKSWLAGAVERCQKADKTFPRATKSAS